jgi:hypothetical protein
MGNGGVPKEPQLSRAQLYEQRQRRLRHLSHAGLALIALGTLVLVWFALTV